MVGRVWSLNKEGNIEDGIISAGYHLRMGNLQTLQTFDCVKATKQYVL